jgi:hypothetical protein
LAEEEVVVGSFDSKCLLVLTIQVEDFEEFAFVPFELFELVG